MTQLRESATTSEPEGERRFNLLWAGQAVSQLGDYLPYVSLPLFVKFLTDGTFEVALAYALDTTPAILVGFLGGALIDRFRLRTTMILTDLLRAVAFAYLAFVAWQGPVAGSRQGLVAVLTVAFVAGTLAAFFNGALFAAVPRLVARDRLAVANARLASSLNLATMLGPALAGILISSVGFWLTFAINSFTFVASATTVAFVGPIGETSGRATTRNYLSESFEGLRHLWGDPRIRVATLGVAFVNFATGFIEGTLVVAFDLIGATEDWQKGLLFTAMGAGALLGAVVAPRLIGRFGNGRVLVSGVIGFGILFGFFVTSTYGVAAFALMFLAFLVFQQIGIPYSTIRQKYTPDHLLGRVATVSRAIAWSTLPVGALIGAGLSDATDFGFVVRAAPILILLTGAVLIRTIVWRDTP